MRLRICAIIFLMGCGVVLSVSTVQENFPKILDDWTFRDVSGDTLAATATVTTSERASVIHPLGSGVARFEIPDDLYATCTLSPSAVANIGSNVGLVLRVDRDYEDTIQLVIGDTATGTTNKYTSAALDAGTHGLTADEWTILWFTANDFTGGGSPAAWCTTWNNSYFSGGRLQVIVDTRIAGGDSGAIVLDVAGIVSNSPSKAKIILMMDGAYDDQYDYAYPAIDAKGWDATLCVVSSWIDTANYMTLAECTTVYNAGWDLINKTSAHTAWDSVASIATVLPEIQTCRNWLMSHNFWRGVNFMQYPSNQAICDSYDAGDYLEAYGVYGRGRLARTRYQAAGTDYHEDLIENTHSPYIPNDWLATAFLPVDVDSDSTYTAGLDARVQTAVFNRAVLQLYVHTIVASSPSGNDITQGLLDDLLTDLKSYEAAGQAEIVTVSEWYNEVNSISGTTAAGAAGVLTGSRGLMGN